MFFVIFLINLNGHIKIDLCIFKILSTTLIWIQKIEIKINTITNE